MEAYEALNFVAWGMRKPVATGVERGATVSRFRDLTFKGLSRTIEFEDEAGAFVHTNGLFLRRPAGRAAPSPRPHRWPDREGRQEAELTGTKRRVLGESTQAVIWSLADERRSRR
ncbi:hypothetical protein [Streptomyces sp. NPDC058595]|uniref:hypothetical protein n=1 Tax=Streptomyces sp. NPDC058595 TaxID=3346550 RepID=UPI003654D982